MADKAEQNERQKELQKKLINFNDNNPLKWGEVDDWSERDIKIVNMFLLHKINQQTNRTAKNAAFMVWIIIIGFILSLIMITQM